MNITMQNLERLSLAEMKEFVEGSRKVCFSTEAREETYGCIEGTLKRQQYRKLSKGQKGIVRRFLVKVTGLSRAQMTRLVGCWTNQRCIPTKMFPFRILGFHCDNGSEFINQKVAEMLNKLLAEFTKSRAYRTTDNALVEGKNGAVVRKHIGSGPIGSEHAGAWHRFYTAYFNPYLNYHRPCGFATVAIDLRGRRKRRYPVNGYRTPYEKLVSLKKWKEYLKPGITADLLARQSKERSDTEAALRMQKAKLELLAKCRSMPR